MSTSQNTGSAVQNLLLRQEGKSVLKLSQRKFDSLLASGEIPCVRIGKSVRIRPADLQKFIDSHVTG